MKVLTQSKLLIIDEVGYLALDEAGAAMLFQIICNRYEKNAATISSRSLVAKRRQTPQNSVRFRLTKGETGGSPIRARVKQK
jgi:hypothetical protein